MANPNLAKRLEPTEAEAARLKTELAKTRAESEVLLAKIEIQDQVIARATSLGTRC